MDATAGDDKGRREGGWHGWPYLGEDAVRLCSYRQQLTYAADLQPTTVLLVGNGDGLVPELLRAGGATVTTLDIDPETRPDVVASVLQMPFDDVRFDVCLCCEVLEHLPFDRFSDALQEIRRVARGHAVLSIPDVSRSIHVAL